MARVHWLDYTIFAVSIVVSLGIGIFHALTGGKQKTKEEYLLGNKKISLLPVTLSLTVSYISANIFLGYPAEIYGFGSESFTALLGTAWGTIMTCVIFIPVLLPLGYTSVNEYLQDRYNSRILKYFACMATIFGAILYSAVAFYGPSTAIAAVTGVPVWVSILVGSCVSILYTTVGGFRAVVWTDVFQSIVMLVGMVVVVIYGFQTVGGFNNVLEINSEWQRTNFFNFDMDPRVRLTFWGLLFGSANDFSFVLGPKQVAYQRWSTMPTIRKATTMLLLSLPLVIILNGLAYTMGWVVFAHYASQGCDPLRAGILQNPNQVVPYYLIDAVNVPGLPGLFMAAVVAASLSSASSALNSASANMWEDVLKEHFPKITPTREALVTKILVLIFGAIAVGLSFAVASAGGTIFQVMATFASSLIGPPMALFLLGMFFPWVSWRGASVGTAVAFAAALWVSFGSYSIRKQLDVLDSPSANCSSPDVMSNMTTVVTTSIADSLMSTTEIIQTTSNVPWTHTLYSISFWFYGLFSCLLSIIVALLATLITCPLKITDTNPALFHPFIRWCFSLDSKTEHSYTLKVKEANESTSF